MEEKITLEEHAENIEFLMRGNGHNASADVVKELQQQLHRANEVIKALEEVVISMANFSGRNNNKHLKDMAQQALAKAREMRVEG